MRAAELAVEAATLRAKWERSRILTVLSALLSVKGVGDAGIRAGPGVQTQLPIFNRNQGSIARADAEVHRAAIAYVALRDDVELEVRRARTEYVQALESLQRVREAILPAVHDSVKLAERAYTDGDASYLFVLEASRQLYDVEILEAQEAAALRRAAANGEHAIGRKW
jgi:cobalt-zinc-cadmium efflux system outer membrane protein